MTRRRCKSDIAALVQPDRVHRDVYLSEELFALEQQHFFANTWSYLGHASQVPNAGDYLAETIAGRPLVMVRQPDASLRVLYNRCAHKGTQLVTDAAGNAGRYGRGSGPRPGALNPRPFDAISAATLHGFIAAQRCAPGVARCYKRHGP